MRSIKAGLGAANEITLSHADQKRRALKRINDSAIGNSYMLPSCPLKMDDISKEKPHRSGLFQLENINDKALDVSLVLPEYDRQPPGESCFASGRPAWTQLEYTCRYQQDAYPGQVTLGPAA